MRRFLEITGGRRAFLCAAARYAALALLAAVAAVAARARAPARQSCGRNGLCGGCDQLAACELPPALSRKRARLDRGAERS